MKFSVDSLKHYAIFRKAVMVNFNTNIIAYSAIIESNFHFLPYSTFRFFVEKPKNIRRMLLSSILAPR